MRWFFYPRRVECRKPRAAQPHFTRLEVDRLEERALLAADLRPLPTDQAWVAPLAASAGADDAAATTGDANDDLQVGAVDYALWAAQFGQQGDCLSADFDMNGEVGLADYTLWAANFGKSIVPHTVTWVKPGGGNWSDPTAWSTGALPGPNDDVVLDIDGDNPIVFDTGSAQVRSIVSNESFRISGGVLHVSSTVQVNNRFEIASGTLECATVLAGSGGQGLIVARPATSSSPTAVLDGVTLNCDLDMAQAGRVHLTIQHGLVLNGTLSLGKADGSAQSFLSFIGDPSTSQTFSGNATVVFGGSSDFGDYSYIANGSLSDGPGTTLTIAPTVTIRGKSGFMVSPYSRDTIINQGTISADVAGGSFYLGDTGNHGWGPFTNQGTLEAKNGGTLLLGGSWSSSGTIEVNNGTLNLGGAFTQESIEHFNRTGGTVDLTGTLTGDLVLGAATGSWNLKGGTLRNGTLSTTNGAVLAGTSSGGTLDGMTVNGDLDLTQQSNAQLTVLNGLVLNGTLSLGKADGSTYGRLNFGNSTAASQTFSGNATVVYGGSTSNQINNASNAAGATLTIAPTVTIRGRSGLLSNQYSTGTIINQGTISADVAGGIFTIGGAGAWSNAGTITAINSTVNLGGSFTQEGLGIFNRTGSTVNLTGTLVGNLALSAATGSWNLLGGTLKNGTLSQTGGATLVFTTSGGTLDGVTVNGDLDLTQPSSTVLTILNGLVLNGTLSLGKADGSTYGRVNFGNAASASQTFSGNAVMILGGSTSNQIYNASTAAGATLTIAPTVTIRGKFVFLGNQYAAGAFVNQGTIAADVVGGALTIGSTGAWSNAGTITAINSTVNLGGSFTQEGLGIFNRTGSTVNLTGTLVGNLALSAATGSWNLLGGTLKNGTLNQTGGATLVFSTSGGTLDGMTVNGDLDLTQQSGAVLTILNGLVLNGTLSVGKADGSTYDIVNFGNATSASQTFSGNATVIFGGSANNRIYNASNAAGATLTIAPTVSIRGKSVSVTNQYSTGMLVNQGTISATVAGGNFTIGPLGTFTNQGTLEAKNGNNLSIQFPTWSNTGTITANDITVNLGGAFTLAGGTFNRTGGTVNLTGTLTGNLALNAATGSWNLLGGTLRNGTLSTTNGAVLAGTSSGGTLDGVTVTGDLDLTQQSGAVLTILNGLVLNGTLSLGKADGSTSGIVRFGNATSASQTLSGNATVFYGGSTSNQIYNASNAVGAALTIAPTVTIRGKSGSLSNSYSTGTIVNQGTISADVAGGTFTIGNLGTFTNLGTLEARNGGTLTLGGNWSSSGTLQVDSGTLTLGGNWSSSGTLQVNGGTLNLWGNWSSSGTLQVNSGTLNLGGTFTQASLGTFNRTGGTVNLTGTLTGNLALGAATGSWNLFGTLKNGTLSTTDGAALVGASSFGTLDGMTVNGDLDLTQQSGVRLTVLNGLVLNGTLSLGKADGSTYGRVNFGNAASASQTLSGNATVVFGGSTSNVISNYSTGAVGVTLTIDTTVTFRGESGTISNASPFSEIVNKGTISVDVAGGQFYLGADGDFTNQGTLIVGVGGRFNILGFGFFTNQGTLDVVGGQFNIGDSGFFTNQGTLIVGVGGRFTSDTLGAFTTAASGTIRVDASGFSSGQFGNVLLWSAQLAGGFSVNFVNGFLPSVGNSFQPLTYTLKSGVFSSITGGSVSFTPTYGFDALTLTVSAVGAGGISVAAGGSAQPSPLPQALPSPARKLRIWDAALARLADLTR